MTAWNHCYAGMFCFVLADSNACMLKELGDLNYLFAVCIIYKV